MRKLHHAILKGTPAWPTTLEKWRPVACLDCHPGHPLRRLELLRVASTCRWECQTACNIRAKRSRSCPARCVCLGGWRDSLPWRTHRPKLNRESSSSGMLLPHRMTRMPMDTLTFSLLSRLKSIIIWVHAVYDVYEIWLILANIWQGRKKNALSKGFRNIMKHPKLFSARHSTSSGATPADCPGCPGGCLLSPEVEWFASPAGVPTASATRRILLAQGRTNATVAWPQQRTTKIYKHHGWLMASSTGNLCSLCADRVPIVLHSALAIWIQVNLPLTMLCDRLVGDVICLYTILYLSPPISSFEILLQHFELRGCFYTSTR